VSRQEEPLLKAASASPSLHTTPDTRIDASEEVGNEARVKSSGAEAIRRPVDMGLGSASTHQAPNDSQGPAESTMAREQEAFLKAMRDRLKTHGMP
jgi:hypothetical protein